MLYVSRQTLNYYLNYSALNARKICGRPAVISVLGMNISSGNWQTSTGTSSFCSVGVKPDTTCFRVRNHIFIHSDIFCPYLFANENNYLLGFCAVDIAPELAFWIEFSYLDRGEVTTYSKGVAIIMLGTIDNNNN